MKNYLKNNYKTIISMFITMLLGTLFHFLYDLTNELSFIKPFVPIDESVFEHLKLIFYPIIIISIIEGIWRKENFLSFISSRAIGAIIALLLLLIFFLIYTGFDIQNHNSFIDITSYYVSIIIAYLIAHSLYLKYQNNQKFNAISIAVIIVTIILFTYFTVNKPDFLIFIEPK